MKHMYLPFCDHVRYPQGDLTAGEIVEQLVHARALGPIRNVVFMGMGVGNPLLQQQSQVPLSDVLRPSLCSIPLHSFVAFLCSIPLHTMLYANSANPLPQEPLNNYNEVRPAVQMMTDPRFFGMRRSAVTVSTVGVIPRILQLADDLPGVSLALSLHAPNQVPNSAGILVLCLGNQDVLCCQIEACSRAHSCSCCIGRSCGRASCRRRQPTSWRSSWRQSRPTSSAPGKG